MACAHIARDMRHLVDIAPRPQHRIAALAVEGRNAYVAALVRREGVDEVLDVYWTRAKKEE